DATTFVKWQYVDILLRQGIASEMAPFVSALNGGTTTRANVIDSLEGSTEFASKVAPIIRLYYSALTRTPDYSGLAFWVGQLRSGASLQSVADFFATTQAFQKTYGTGTPRQFVIRVFQNVLGRAPTTAERQSWVAQVKSGAATRSQVVRQISESAESVQTSASKVFVTSLYVGMLRRAPTKAELNSGITTANQSHVTLINSILSSQEYHNRVFQ
ncbi:MAG TPA: DUF4214 domain-containing protein, partial [Candidatus Bathyarchaeia archaeon]|nr:DUF4214 domain-containing protein [Candidatus Bathyarchaeia archaeon]